MAVRPLPIHYTASSGPLEVTVSRNKLIWIGMENSCLTFATPSLIAGDRSNVDVAAHEISHVCIHPDREDLASLGRKVLTSSLGSVTVSELPLGTTSG